jgi:4,5-DOPA dioxygenase extradiol
MAEHPSSRPSPSRRDLGAGAAAAAALACVGADDRGQDAATPMPALFVSHGAPSLALDPVAGADLARVGASLPRPRALLVVSAHWEETPIALGTVAPRALLHDYGGFAPELRDVRYDAPTAPALAARVRGLLAGVPGGVVDRPSRPWDHGVWVPLLHLVPRADVPLLQVSLPSHLTPSQLIDVGRRLAPLRDEGVLVVGSGGAVHNLRELAWDGGAPTPRWALDFEAWLREHVARFDLDTLAAVHERAPALRRAHPTEEHLLPLFVTLGAAADRPPTVRFPIEGFELGSLSRLTIELT